ncbi:hypothetical protein HDU85_004823 [Gaertneriomyces sp. JEL0708]|nr:hypothetical protein HDU85_004823 [Gaertneriomyces sp. JEL0708]
MYLSLPFLQVLKVSFTGIVGKVDVRPDGRLDRVFCRVLGVLFLCGAVMLEGLRRLMTEKAAELLDLQPVEQLLCISPAATVFSTVTFLAMELRRMTSQGAVWMRVDLIIVNVASLAGLYVVNLLMFKFSRFASSTASIFRDLVILLVAFFVFGTTLTGVQLFGYAIATFAFMWYYNEEILRRNFRRGNPQRALVIGTQTQTQTVEREKFVIVSRAKEDISWLPLYLHERIPYIVYQKGDPKATHNLPNKGNEASTYMKFILDNWENLPKRMAFIHGHRQSWHSTGPVDELLLQGNWDAAPFIKIPASFHHIKNLTIDDRSLSEDAEGNWRLKVFWDRFYSEHLGPPPEIIEYTCCAQFIVHSSIVYSRPKQLYQEIYDFLMSGEWADYWSGRMLEYTWHVLFTGEPRETQIPFP